MATPTGIDATAESRRSVLRDEVRAALQSRTARC